MLHRIIQSEKWAQIFMRQRLLKIFNGAKISISEGVPYVESSNKGVFKNICAGVWNPQFVPVPPGGRIAMRLNKFSEICLNFTKKYFI